MGWTIMTSFRSRVTFSRRSPVAMSNGCAPVLPSYSAINLLTSSMSAVAGSYSRSVVSPWDENVRILDFMLGLLRDVPFRFPVGKQSAVLVPKGHTAPFLGVVKTAPRANDSEEPGPRSHPPSPTVNNITVRFSRCRARRKYFRQHMIVLKGQIRSNVLMILLGRTCIFRSLRRPLRDRHCSPKLLPRAPP